MREIFNILNQKERKVIGVLCLLVLVALFLLFYVALGEKRTYLQTFNSFTDMKENQEKIIRTQNQKKEEWFRWQEAGRDIDEIGEKYFYKDNDVFQQIRLDLQKIFNQAGIGVSRIKYDYAEIEDKKVKKVNVSFNLRGSYFSLKRFLNAVEKYPKFLIIEEINFLNIEAQGGTLELRILLAGYYAS